MAVAKLDDVLDGDIGFIKIDVEGHELSVLEGASSLIERCRPVLLIECEERHNPGGPAALFRHLKKAGYIGRFLREGIICDIGEFRLTRDQVAMLAQLHLQFLLLPGWRSSRTAGE